MLVTLHTHCSDVQGQSTLLVGRGLLGRYSWICHWSLTLWKGLNMLIVQVSGTQSSWVGRILLRRWSSNDLLFDWQIKGIYIYKPTIDVLFLDQLCSVFLWQNQVIMTCVSAVLKATGFYLCRLQTFHLNQSPNNNQYTIWKVKCNWKVIFDLDLALTFNYHYSVTLQVLAGQNHVQIGSIYPNSKLSVISWISIVNAVIYILNTNNLVGSLGMSSWVEQKLHSTKCVLLVSLLLLRGRRAPQVWGSDSPMGMQSELECQLIKLFWSGHMNCMFIFFYM